GKEHICLGIVPLNLFPLSLSILKALNFSAINQLSYQSTTKLLSVHVNVFIVFE
ncbi:hypothetical protein KSS87_022015, partial [Heliosperma pusillum]